MAEAQGIRGVFAKCAWKIDLKHAHDAAPSTLYNPPMPYLFLAIAIASEVCATSFMKLSEGFTRPVPSIVTAIGYAIAFISSR